METPPHPDSQPPDEPLHPDLDFLPSGLLDLPESAAGLRESVLRGSLVVLRNRRLRRRLAFSCAVVGLYALGFLSARLVGIPEAPSEEPLAQSKVLTARGLEQPEEVRDPELLEHLARRGSQRQRADRLRRAGDLYLAEGGDLEAALRCYSDYLVLAGPGESTQSDTWLLAALKHDLN